MHCKNSILILLISFSLSSCALFHEDMTAINELVLEEEYSEAIIQLDEMTSSFAKKKNSEVHVEYAISILKNTSEDKRTRYITAQDILEKALQLDPKNKEAKTYYLMVLKLSKNV